MKLQGVFTALITPFVHNEIDIATFKKLVQSQVSGGVSGIVVCGTTGESPTLTEDEFKLLVKTAIVESHHQIKVFVGVGSCNTSVAVHKTQWAHEAGADGMLVVTPYYNKPTQVGLLDYYSQIAEATDRPIILYTVPSRCGVEIAISTAMTLHQRHPHICAIKEASPQCRRVEKLSSFSENFFVLSGDDGMTLPFMSLGATGVVSVASNLYPREMAQMVAAAQGNDFHTAKKIYDKLLPTMDLMFIETNPLPIKYLMAHFGKITSSECRSPLGQLSDESIQKLSNIPAL